jgi:hypothetical protein
MSDLYGSQGENIASSAFIWASEMEVVPIANAASYAGEVRTGYLPYSTFFDEAGNTGDFNIQDLIRISSPQAVGRRHTM